MLGQHARAPAGDVLAEDRRQGRRLRGRAGRDGRRVARGAGAPRSTASARRRGWPRRASTRSCGLLFEIARPAPKTPGAWRKLIQGRRAGPGSRTRERVGNALSHKRARLRRPWTGARRSWTGAARGPSRSRRPGPTAPTARSRRLTWLWMWSPVAPWTASSRRRGRCHAQSEASTPRPRGPLPVREAVVAAAQGRANLQQRESSFARDEAGEMRCVCCTYPPANRVPDGPHQAARFVSRSRSGQRRRRQRGHGTRRSPPARAAAATSGTTRRCSARAARRRPDARLRGEHVRRPRRRAAARLGRDVPRTSADASGRARLRGRPGRARRVSGGRRAPPRQGGATRRRVRLRRRLVPREQAPSTRSCAAPGTSRTRTPARLRPAAFGGAGEQRGDGRHGGFRLGAAAGPACHGARDGRDLKALIERHRGAAAAWHAPGRDLGYMLQPSLAAYEQAAVTATPSTTDFQAARRAASPRQGLPMPKRTRAALAARERATERDVLETQAQVTRLACAPSPRQAWRLPRSRCTKARRTRRALARIRGVREMRVNQVTSEKPQPAAVRHQHAAPSAADGTQGRPKLTMWRHMAPLLG